MRTATLVTTPHAGDSGNEDSKNGSGKIHSNNQLQWNTGEIYIAIPVTTGGSIER